METRIGRNASVAVSTKAWAAVLVVVILVCGIGLFLIERGGESQSTSTSSTSTSPVLSVTSTNAVSGSNGLELSLTLNASGISAGQVIASTVEVLNTMPTSNNVTAASAWPVGSLAVGPCGTVNFPMGVAVLRGNYAVSNASSGSALQLYQPGEYSCPAELSRIGSYFFRASSDNATFFGSCQPEPCFTERTNATVTARGYWAGGAFETFQPGVYTVVAGDEWGDFAILHFKVV